MVSFSYVSYKYVSCGKREREGKGEKEKIVYILLELDRDIEKNFFYRVNHMIIDSNFPPPLYYLSLRTLSCVALLQ